MMLIRCRHDASDATLSAAMMHTRLYFYYCLHDDMMPPFIIAAARLLIFILAAITPTTPPLPTSTCRHYATPLRRHYAITPFTCLHYITPFAAIDAIITMRRHAITP